MECSALALQRQGGVTRYLAETANGIHKILPGFRVGLFSGSDGNALYNEIVQLPSIPISWRSLLPYGFAFDIAKHRFDIVHSPYFLMPPKNKHRANLLTVHDLIFLEGATSPRGHLRRILFNEAIKRADHVVCVSETTRQDVLQRYGHSLRATDVSMVHNGCSDIFHTEILATTTNQNPYLLWVGARSGYKNFLSFVKGFAQTRDAKNLSLAIVGGGDLGPEELAALTNIRYQHITNTSDARLRELYSGAIALVYPSDREGFGLPIIEAMLSHCPVICQSQSSMGEIAAGHHVPLVSFVPDAIAASIAAAVQLKSDPVRLKSIRTYAKKFTWTKTAFETAALYGRLK